MNFTAPEQQTLKLSQSPACFRMADNNQVLSYGSPPFVRFWTYLTKFLKNITVEPVVFLYAVGFSLTMVVSPALYFEKICRVSHFLRNPYQGEKTRVRARTWTCKTGWFDAYFGNIQVHFMLNLGPFLLHFVRLYALVYAFCAYWVHFFVNLFHALQTKKVVVFRLAALCLVTWQLTTKQHVII